MAQLVRLDGLDEAMWEEILAGERSPWGGVGEALQWRAKPLNIGVRDDDGRLLAAGGVVLAQVRAGAERFDVAGLGGLIVTRGARGQGLARLLATALLDAASELGPERAMLFCVPGLMPLYASFGFAPIDAPVSAEQPGGRIDMPLRAMWRTLRGEQVWPPGAVEVVGEPF